MLILGFPLLQVGELLLCVRCAFGKERHSGQKLNASRWYAIKLDRSLASIDRELPLDFTYFISSCKLYSSALFYITA